MNWINDDAKGVKPLSILGFDIKVVEGIPPGTVMLIPKPTYNVILRCDGNKQKLYEWLLQNTVLLGEVAPPSEES